jgi:hypothetical protein
MPSWFGKSKPRETSPGGSVINRYGPELAGPPIGVTESSAEFARAREAVYDRFFGAAAHVSHEIVPLVPHVDVYIHQPGPRGRDFYTLATGGMSDLEMSVPAKAKGVPRRVELIFYCREPQQEYIDLLRGMAHFPHNNRTWLGSGHTMPNGVPPEPFLGSPVLDTLLFMPTILTPDGKLADELNLAGAGVHFLWVVPLTTLECNLKLEKGFDAVLDLFDRHRHPHIFDPGRKSYV